MNLNTRYMGLELAHPIVASSSPLSQSLAGMQRLEKSGAAAIVMFSLFEEQIQQEIADSEPLLNIGPHSFSESVTYLPQPDIWRVGAERYFELIREAHSVLGIPLIASFNGTTVDGSVRSAVEMQTAGADAIELNLFHVAAEVTHGAGIVEQRYIDIVQAVRAAVRIPVSIKLGPFFSSFANMALCLEMAGANALVLFNRFYQPDIDLQQMELTTDLELSTASEVRLPLRWIALLQGRLMLSLAASTGVESGKEVVKFLLAGADVVMTTSALLRHGPAHLAVLRDELIEWMKNNGYTSLEELRGSMSQHNVADPAAFARANYLKILGGYRVKATS